MKRSLLCVAAGVALFVLSSCNELPMEAEEHEAAPHGPDPTVYLPPQQQSDNPLNGGYRP